MDFIPFKRIPMNVPHKCWFEYGKKYVIASLKRQPNGAVGWQIQGSSIYYGTGVLLAVEERETV